MAVWVRTLRRMPHQQVDDDLAPAPLLDDTASLAAGGTWSVDLWTWHLNWSPHARALHEVTKTVTPTAWEAIQFIDPQDRAELVSVFFGCVNEGAPFELEVGLTTAAGNRRRARITGFAAHDDEGRMTRVKGIIQEIALIEEHHAELDDSRTAKQLLALLRESEALAYALPHELRTPLVAVQGFARAIEGTESHLLTTRGRHFLSRILAGTRLLDRLVKGLLTLAPLSTVRLRREPVDVSAVAALVLDTFAAAQPARNVECSVQPDLVADADPDLVALVLQNLLGNALKFTAGSEPARVSFEATRAGPELTFAVRDNGVGFAMDDAAQLFVPFTRLHDREQFDGCGLGLAIAKRVVERHGGRIWAEAAPGQGAAFFFTLAA